MTHDYPADQQWGDVSKHDFYSKLVIETFSLLIGALLTRGPRCTGAAGPPPTPGPRQAIAGRAAASGGGTTVGDETYPTVLTMWIGDGVTRSITSGCR